LPTQYSHIYGSEKTKTKSKYRYLAR